MKPSYVIQMLDSNQILRLTKECKQEIAIEKGKEKSGLAYESALKTIYRELKSREFSKFPATGLYTTATKEVWMQGTCYVIRFKEGMFDWIETKGMKRFPFRQEWVTEGVEPDERQKGYVRYEEEWFDTKRIETICKILGDDYKCKLTASLFMRGHRALMMQTARGTAWLMPYRRTETGDEAKKGELI